MKEVYLSDETIPGIVKSLRGHGESLIVKIKESDIVFKVTEHYMQEQYLNGDGAFSIETRADVHKLRDHYGDNLEEVTALFTKLLDRFTDTECYDMIIFHIPLIMFVDILVNNKRTLSDSLIDSDITPKYDALTIEQMGMLTNLLGLSSVDKKALVNNVHSISLGLMLDKRIHAFNLHSSVSDDGMLFWIVLGIGSPAALMLYLIALTDFHTVNERAADAKDIATLIFPDGFYTRETVTVIKNEIIKTNKSINGFIY